jgi:hypothetical protein
MDTQQAEAVRLRIVAAIGRDAPFITASDQVRHFDGVSFVAFYGGQLLLHFVAAALPKFWDKLNEAAAKKLVDVTWESAAHRLKAAFATGDATSDAEQVKQVRAVSSGLDELGRAVEQQYLATFIDAGRAAVEARLREDHLPSASAKRIAAAVAREVENSVAAGGSAHAG